MACNSNDSFPSFSNASSSWDTDDITDADFLRFNRIYPTVRDRALAQVPLAFRADKLMLIKVEDGIDERMVQVFNLQGSTANAIPSSPSHPFSFRPSPATVAGMEAQFEIAPPNWPAFDFKPLNTVTSVHVTEGGVESDDETSLGEEDIEEDDADSVAPGDLWQPDRESDGESKGYASDHEAELDQVVAVVVDADLH